ncbi:20418_t:CDS:2, partial [Racocetra persica]
KENKAIKPKVVVREAEEVRYIKIEEKKHCERRSHSKGVSEWVKKKIKDNDVANIKHVRDKFKRPEKYILDDIQMVNDKAPKDIDHEIDNADKMVKGNMDIRCIDFNGKKN